MTASEYERSLDPSNWLSYYVSREKRRIRKLGLLQRISEDISLAWKTEVISLLTSKWSFILILFLFFLYYLFPIDQNLYLFVNLVEPKFEYFLTLWQVHSAIIGIAFVIIIFLFEMLSSRIPEAYRNLENRFRHEFYKRSAILPLLFYNLFSIVYIGITVAQSSRLFQNITLLLVSILSICYLFAKAFTFFQTDSLEKVRLEIIINEVNRSVETEIDRRISTNLLYQIAERNKNLEFSLMIRPQILYSDLIPIDLDIDEIREITDINIKSILTTMEMCNGKFFIYKGIGYTISPRDRVVGWVSNGVTKEVIEKLRKCFRSRKVVLKRDLDLAFDDLQNEINGAIDKQNLQELTRIWDIYYRIMESFLKSLHFYGIRYDAKITDGEWRPLRRILLDYFLVIDNALRSGNKEIIKRIINFPYIMLTLATQNLDHLIFKRFKGFFATIYFKSLEEDDLLQKFIAEQFLSTIETYISVNLLYVLQHNDLKKEEINEYLSYLIESLGIYENLLRAAMEKERIEDFKRFEDSLDNILEHFKPDRDRPYLIEIETKLRNPQLRPEEQEKWRKILEIRKEKINVRNRAENYIQQIWFGLGGWLSELFRKEKIEETTFKELYEQIGSHFTDLKSFSSLFLSSIDLFEAPHDWKWWRIRNNKSNFRFLIEADKINDWLIRFYCIQGSRLTPHKITSPDIINPSPKLKNRIASIKRICDEIKQEMEKWSSVIAEGDAKRSCQKVDNFLRIITFAVKKQRKIEDDWLINQPLSQKKIAEFKSAVIEEWEKSSEIRSLIMKFGKFVDTKTVNKQVNAFGINRLVPKDPFVEGLYAGPWAGLEKFGQDLSKIEGMKILKDISKHLEGKRLQFTHDNFLKKLEKAIKQMRSQGNNPNIIIVGKWDNIRKMSESPNFLAKWEETAKEIQISGFEGYFDNIPVFLYAYFPNNHILVCDLQKLGTLFQYRIEEEENILKFLIKVIDEKKAREYIEKNPDLLKDKNGKIKSMEKAVYDLQKNVHLLILEKFEYKVEDENAGLLLEIVQKR